MSGRKPRNPVYSLYCCFGNSDPPQIPYSPPLGSDCGTYPPPLTLTLTLIWVTLALMMSLLRIALAFSFSYLGTMHGILWKALPPQRYYYYKHACMEWHPVEALTPS